MHLPTPIPLSRGAMRAQNLRTRLETLRTQAVSAKEAEARPDRSAASSREFITKNLGKKEGPIQGTSIARLSTNRGLSSSNGSGLAMPPVLPSRKF